MGWMKLKAKCLCYCEWKKYSFIRIYNIAKSTENSVAVLLVRCFFACEYASGANTISIILFSILFLITRNLFLGTMIHSTLIS